MLATLLLAIAPQAAPASDPNPRIERPLDLVRVTIDGRDDLRELQALGLDVAQVNLGRGTVDLVADELDQRLVRLLSCSWDFRLFQALFF